jgi:hypothetical protein
MGIKFLKKEKEDGCSTSLATGIKNSTRVVISCGTQNTHLMAKIGRSV